jgi:hypothetical protein
MRRRILPPHPGTNRHLVNHVDPFEDSCRDHDERQSNRELVKSLGLGIFRHVPQERENHTRLNDHTDRHDRLKWGEVERKE